MPRSSKNQRKNARRSSSRLADKKINTLVEKRMEEIAKKEAQKAERHYVQSYCTPSALESNYETGVSVVNANSSLFEHNGTNIDKSLLCEYWPITTFGNDYVTNDSDSTTNVRFRVKQVQAFIKLWSVNNQPYQVCMALIGIPNANKRTAAVSNDIAGETSSLTSHRAMLTKNNWKFAPTDSGIFEGHYLRGNPTRDIKYHVLDRKTVTVPPCANLNSDGTQQESNNPKKVIHVSLGKRYKNPKKLEYLFSAADEEDNQLMNNYNIYLVMSTDKTGNDANKDSLINFQSIAGCKFSLGNDTVPRVIGVSPL